MARVQIHLLLCTLVSLAGANSLVGGLFGDSAKHAFVPSSEICMFAGQFLLLAVLFLIIQVRQAQKENSVAKVPSDSNHSDHVRTLWNVFNQNLQTAISSFFVIFVCSTILVLPYFFERGIIKPVDKLIVLSVAADVFGLIILRHKIEHSGSVRGVSGQSVCMFTVTKFYVATDCPRLRSQELGIWGVKVLDWFSLILIVDVLRCIFIKYRETYQDDIDRLKAKYIIVASAFFALSYQPAPYELQKTFELFLDTFSALPQVVMMVHQQDNVEAPIAHFLVVTSMSRISDLFEWCNRFHFWEHPFGMQFSHVVIIACHVAYTVTVADFLYLYSKVCLGARSLSIDIPMDVDVV